MRIIEKRKNTYYCTYCGFGNTEQSVILDHIEKHELVLIPIAKQEMNLLNQFFFSGDRSLIPTNFVRVLQRYIRESVRNG